MTYPVGSGALRLQYVSCSEHLHAVANGGDRALVLCEPLGDFDHTVVETDVLGGTTSRDVQTCIIWGLYVPVCMYACLCVRRNVCGGTTQEKERASEFHVRTGIALWLDIVKVIVDLKVVSRLL